MVMGKVTWACSQCNAINIDGYCDNQRCWACGLALGKTSEEKTPMICNLYEVAIVRDTLMNAATGEKKTEILVSPTVITATGAQAARDRAVRLLTDEQAEDLDNTRIFIREFSSTYGSGWNK